MGAASSQVISGLGTTPDMQHFTQQNYSHGHGHGHGHGRGHGHGHGHGGGCGHDHGHGNSDRCKSGNQKKHNSFIFSKLGSSLIIIFVTCGYIFSYTFQYFVWFTFNYQ